MARVVSSHRRSCETAKPTWQAGHRGAGGSAGLLLSADQGKQGADRAAGEAALPDAEAVGGGVQQAGGDVPGRVERRASRAVAAAVSAAAVAGRPDRTAARLPTVHQDA